MAYPPRNTLPPSVIKLVVVQDANSKTITYNNFSHFLVIKEHENIKCVVSDFCYFYFSKIYIYAS